jgi:hypothetical protein
MLDDELAGRCVLIFQVARVALCNRFNLGSLGRIDSWTCNASQKPVIWQELEPCRLDVRLQSVELYAVLVVDEDIFLLCDGKM